MSKNPQERDFFSLFKKKIDSQPVIKSKPKFLFALLVDRIKKTLQHAEVEDVKLSGRVQKLTQTSLAVLRRLTEIKEVLKNNLEADLFNYVDTLMQPMTRDVVSIQKLLTHQSSVIQQAKAYKKYSNWMIKAELWLDLEKKIEDREAITKTIILHVMQELDELVDQDLQVICDYQNHQLDSLPLTEEEAWFLKKRLEREILVETNNLQRLKDRPVVTGVQEVFAWKDELGRKRSKYFDRALHIIDEIIHEVSPGSTSEEEHEHLVDVLTQIAFLEEEIPSLQKESVSCSAHDPIRKALMEVKWNAFEEELHRLNLNLRLTPELVDRLQVLIQTMSYISKKLNS